MTTHFGDRLVEAVRAKKSVLCVGLDPQLDLMPAHYRRKERFRRYPHPYGREGAAIASFCRDRIDSVARYAVVVKPQVAFFEQYGAPGYEALEASIAYAKDNGLLVVTDAKRGDGGATAQAYADGHLGSVMNIELDRTSSTLRVDAMTVNPCIGDACLEPFVETVKATGTGIFIVVKTSFKPESRFEEKRVNDGLKLWEAVANEAVAWLSAGTRGSSGYHSVGAVFGATCPDDAPAMRRYLRQHWFLVPGYGAQGASADDAVKAANDDGLGVLVNSSRGIIYAEDPAEAARQARDELNAALERAGKPFR